MNSSNLFLAAIALSCCLAVNCAPTSSSSKHQQHQQQQQQQQQLQQHQQQKQHDSLNKLMISQLSTTDIDNNKFLPIKSLLLAEKKPQLKKKWHKLVDEMIDNDQLVAVTTSAQTMVNKPVARRRQPVAEQQQNKQQLQQTDNDNNENHAVLVKTKPALDDSQALISPLLIAMNNIGQTKDGQVLVSTERPVDMAEHQRRIVNDGFGIVREASSKHSTNNHLGYKDMPKFGSDEQF